jgi:hypothetical protein
MGFLNRTKKTQDGRAEAHLNWMGGPSYNINDPVLRLRLAASSCFFGEPMYYQRDAGDQRRPRPRMASSLSDVQVAYLRATLNAVDPQAWRGLTPAELLEQAIDAALAADPERTLQEAVRLRQQEHIRTTPQVILVRAANHPAVRGSGLVGRYAPQIIARADEPAVGLAYQLARYGKPIPNALKRCWRVVLQGYDDYGLAKYRMERREAKTVDVVNLVHPKSAPVDRLVRGELSTSDRTWEAIISAKGSTAEAWMEALEAMGHMALLRNLRNLLKVGIDPKHYLGRLVEGAARGKQLPFRYYSAYRAVKDAAPVEVLAAIEQCLMTSLGNLPRFNGRVMALCDNSGSARGNTTSSMGTMTIATIANLTAILAGMRASEGYAGVFGDRLEVRPIDRAASVFQQLDTLEVLGQGIGGGTENGIWLFWDQALSQRQYWDMVFVFSDMQAGHGGLYGCDRDSYRDYIWSANGAYIDVPKLIATYRARVNPEVLVFLVQVAGYQDVIVPEFYDRTYVLGGWSEGLLRFAAEMARLNER